MRLGLTSWVLRVDLVRMLVAVLALQRRSRSHLGTSSGAVHACVGLAPLIFIAGPIRQIYMKVYVIDPTRVDMAEEVRRGLPATIDQQARRVRELGCRRPDPATRAVCTGFELYWAIALDDLRRE